MRTNTCRDSGQQPVAGVGYVEHVEVVANEQENEPGAGQSFQIPVQEKVWNA